MHPLMNTSLSRQPWACAMSLPLLYAEGEGCQTQDPRSALVPFFHRVIVRKLEPSESPTSHWNTAHIVVDAHQGFDGAYIGPTLSAQSDL